jgi:Fic family protein
MAYTEIQKRGKNEYYYRVISIRNGDKVSKKRIFLGNGLTKDELAKAEKKADRELGTLDSLLTDEDIKVLEKIKKRYEKVPKITSDNRYEAFTSLFTHDSTAIEGNTLTLQETASLLFDEIVPSKRNLREINEVLNHKKAFDFILGYEKDITKKFICDLHRLVLKDTISKELEPQIGRYRTVQVFIRGLDWIPPEPKHVPKDMRDLLMWYSKNKGKLHPLVVAIYFHVGFETVHPFVDGNGRVGRLLLNFILHKNGYPMVNIPNVERHIYYEVLREAQVGGNLRPFIEFLKELLKENTVFF